MSASDPRRHAPATARNRAALLAVLRDELPPVGTVLEIGAGSGEHAAYFAAALGPDIVWQPSDPEGAARASVDAHARASAAAARIRPALALDAATPVSGWPIAAADAIFCANVVHISPWSVAEGLLAGAGALLPAGGPLMLYGPFRRAGTHTAASNADFDRSLRARDPSWGVRDLEAEMLPEAARHGLALAALHEMPANNLCVVLRKG